MNEQIVYKGCGVFQRKGKVVFTSSFVHGTELEAIYKIGKKTTPKVGKLFAYFDLDEAVTDYHGIVFRCKATGVKKARRKIFTLKHNILRFYTSFWKGKSTGHTPPHRSWCFCESITPIEIVVYGERYI